MILSVSRRTDIPNYYSDWFYERIQEGFLYVRNPFRAHQISKIPLSPDTVDCIVFWTKNPENMMDRLEELKDYKYYFQFTLTGYGKDIEPGVPHKRERMLSVFRALSEKIGSHRVIWRYDPILVNDIYTPEYHCRAFQEIAGSLRGYTEKAVISFIDFYAKTRRNMENLRVKQMTEEDMFTLAERLAAIAKTNRMAIESCAEIIDLHKAGIEHGCCIDKKRIEKVTGCRIEGVKDKNQRKECGCLESIDVGVYNTCRNGCKYCYANFSDTCVKENAKRYDVNSPVLCGTVMPEDIIMERKVKSLKVRQIGLFDQVVE